MTWEYYSFGNAALFLDLLTGIRAIIGLDSYQWLIVILCLGSFFFVVISKALKGKAHEVLLYFILIAVGMAMIFGTTMNIRIVDKLPGFGPQVATDIPIGIGVPIVFANNVGWEITEWYETHMATAMPNGLKLSSGAPYSSASRVLKDMQEVRLTDPALRTQLSNYMRDCKLPDLYQDPSQLRVWLNADNIVDAIASNNGLILTSRSEGDVLTCAASYLELEAVFDAWTAGTPTDFFTIGGANLGIKGTGSSAVQGAVSSMLSNAQIMDAVVGELGGGSFNSNSFLLGNLIAPEITDSVRDTALLTDSNSVISAINISQAEKTQTTGWETAAILFQDMAGYLFAILNLVVVGLSPIIILGIFIPNFGIKVMVGFIKVMVWLALWWPALALVNHISTMYLFQGISSSLIADFGAVKPWSVGGATMLTDFGAKASMAAGFVSTFVPMIMWGIISGSGQAFTSALQAASGKAEASAAAKNIATDSASMGQVSYNNVSANTHDISSQRVYGDQGAQYHADVGGAGSRIRHFDGRQDYMANQDITEKVKVSSQENVVDSVQRRNTLSESISRSNDKLESEMSSVVNGYMTGSDGTHKIAGSETVSQGTKNTSDVAAAIVAGTKQDHKFASTEAVMTQAALQVAGSISQQWDLNGPEKEEVNRLVKEQAEGKEGATKELSTFLSGFGDADKAKQDAAKSEELMNKVGDITGKLGVDLSGSAKAIGTDSRETARSQGTEEKTTGTERTAQEQGYDEKIAREHAYLEQLKEMTTGNSGVSTSISNHLSRVQQLNDEFSTNIAKSGSEGISTEQTLLAPTPSYGTSNSYDPNQSSRELIDRKSELEGDRNNTGNKFSKESAGARNELDSFDNEISNNHKKTSAQVDQSQAVIASYNDRASRVQSLSHEKMKGDVDPSAGVQMVNLLDKKNDMNADIGLSADHVKFKDIDLGAAGKAEFVGTVGIGTGENEDRKVESVYSLKDSSGNERFVYFASNDAGGLAINQLNGVTKEGLENNHYTLSDDRFSDRNAGSIVYNQTKETVKDTVNDASGFLSKVGNTIVDTAADILPEGTIDNRKPFDESNKPFTEGTTITRLGDSVDNEERFSVSRVGSISSSSELSLSGSFNVEDNLSKYVDQIGGANSPNMEYTSAGVSRPNKDKLT